MSVLKYPSINGLRAISIILVIIYHLQMNNDIFTELSLINWLEPFISFVTDGHLGVNVFFVISGFLITSLMLNEELNTGTVSLKGFYLRRILRIFPAYFALLLVYSILQLFGYIHISDASWLTAITHTKYFNWSLDWYTAHGWSLSIEEHFYIFWPLIFISRKGWRKTVAVFLIFIVPIIRIADNLYQIRGINELTIFMRVDSIAMGCFFALYKDSILKAIAPHWKKIFYISLIGLFLLRYFPMLADKINMGYIFIPLGSTHGSVANILIALLMMYSIFGPKGIWYQLLNLKAVNYIGLLSYSIYLWQQIFISGSTNWFNQFPANLMCIALVALSSYYLIEKPFLKLKSRFNTAQFTGRKISRRGSTYVLSELQSLKMNEPSIRVPANLIGSPILVDETPSK